MPEQTMLFEMAADATDASCCQEQLEMILEDLAETVGPSVAGLWDTSSLGAIFDLFGQLKDELVLNPSVFDDQIGNAVSGAAFCAKGTCQCGNNMLEDELEWAEAFLLNLPELFTGAKWWDEATFEETDPDFLGQLLRMSQRHTQFARIQVKVTTSGDITSSYTFVSGESDETNLRCIMGAQRNELLEVLSSVNAPVDIIDVVADMGDTAVAFASTLIVDIVDTSAASHLSGLVQAAAAVCE